MELVSVELKFSDIDSMHPISVSTHMQDIYK